MKKSFQMDTVWTTQLITISNKNKFAFFHHDSSFDSIHFQKENFDPNIFCVDKMYSQLQISSFFLRKCWWISAFFQCPTILNQHSTHKRIHSWWELNPNGEGETKKLWSINWVAIRSHFRMPFKNIFQFLNFIKPFWLLDPSEMNISYNPFKFRI